MIADRKTNKANLERKRPYFFVVGLLVVVLFFVILLKADAFFEEDINTSYVRPMSFEEQMMQAVMVQMAVATPAEAPPRLDIVKVVPNKTEVKQEMKVDAESLTDADKTEKSFNHMVDGELFTVVQDMPQFPGGTQARDLFMQKNLRYPPKAMKSGIQGIVIISFIVQKDGLLSNFNVEQKIGGGCEEEALRVIKSMPKWIPGRQGGVTCNVVVRMPIAFYFKR